MFNVVLLAAPNYHHFPAHITAIIASDVASYNGQMCDLGLFQDKNEETIAFLVFSLLQTYLTIILSVIGSINLRKGGQLDIKAKILLGLSVSCQMWARLWIMLAIAWSSILQYIRINSAQCVHW